MRSSAVTLILLLCLSASCAGIGRAKWTPVDVGDTDAFPLGPYGGLQHRLRVASSDGRTMRLRGLIHNPYDGPVEGVRIVIRILADMPPKARELDRMSIEMTDVRLESGQQTALGRDLQTMYTSNKFVQLGVFAIKRDGKKMPPPPESLDSEATQIHVVGAPLPNAVSTDFLSGF